MVWPNDDLREIPVVLEVSPIFDANPPPPPGWTQPSATRCVFKKPDVFLPSWHLGCLLPVLALGLRRLRNGDAASAWRKTGAAAPRIKI